MLEHYVKDLLYEKDCVVIPGFGAIVANYQSATINQSKQSIAPPSKQLAFNKSLRSNDGLLANYLADQEQITFAKALKQVREEANQWKRKLGNGETIELPGIGSLHSNNEGNVLFKPDKATNFHPDSFGLSEARLIPVKRSANHPKPVSANFTTKKHHKRPSPVLIGLSSVGVTAVLLFFLLNLNLFEASRVSNPIASFKDYLSSNEASNESIANQTKNASKQGPSVPPEPSKSYNGVAKAHDKNDDNASFDSGDQEVTKSLEKAEKEAEKSQGKSIEELDQDALENSGDGSDSYHLIAGSFKNMANAKLLARKAKRRGYAVSILDGPNGFTRVSIANYNSNTEAREFRNRIQQKGIFEVWLLEKNNHRNS